MSAAAQNCDPACPANTQYYNCMPSPYFNIKSRAPALVELDPYSLKIKGPNSYWELPLSPFMEGISGSGSASDPSLYLLSLDQTAMTSSVSRWNFSTGKAEKVFDLGFPAYSMTHKDGNFYVAGLNTVSRVGGASVATPLTIAGMTYISDSNGDYLLAIARNHQIQMFEIPLVNGEPAGAIIPFSFSFDGGYNTSQYSGVSYARVLWEDGKEREVLYFTKDDYLTLPFDYALIVDFHTGEVLKKMYAPHSGIILSQPVAWPGGATSNYLSWANPQGMAYIDGRLFMASRYHWNNGPLQPSCYSYTFKASVNGQDADTLSSAAGVREGDPLTYRFEVKNDGLRLVNWKNLSDSAFGDLTARCFLPKTVLPGETGVCEFVRIADRAPEGQAHVGKATVDCLPDQLNAAWYRTQSGPSGTTLAATTTAAGSWKKTVEYNWAVQKTANPLSLTIGQGQSGSVTYTVSLTRSVASEASQYAVSGQVCVTNGGSVPTENLKIWDRIQYKTGEGQFQDLSGAALTLIPAQPLSAGQSACYPFNMVLSPVAGAAYRNVAKVTITNHSGHLGEEFGPEPKADFTLPTSPALTEIDAQASLTDAVGCPSGLVCSPASQGPWLFPNSASTSYAVTIQNASSACNATAGVTNTATLVESTTGQQGTSSAKVSISTGPCPGENCTYSHGYWKTHPEKVQPLLPVSLGATGGAKSLNILTSSAAVAVLEMKTYGSPSNGITKLYAQLLAARLNIKKGASASAVTATLNAADAFLGQYDWKSWDKLSAKQKNDALGWMTTLDNYNNGLIGPGHCSETTSVGSSGAPPAAKSVAPTKPVKR